MAIYLYPTNDVSFEEVIKKSRFITYLSHVESKDEALAFLADLKELYPDARHHCWAYVIGDPSCTATVGMSDDGEPHGTAGRPMLGVLQSKNVGDVMVVCVRYFGGTKLGTGGLVRAYSTGVIEALELAKLTEKIPLCEILVRCPFSMESFMRRFVIEHELKVVDVEYSNNVCFRLEFASSKLDDIKSRVIDMSNGQAVLELMNS